MNHQFIPLDVRKFRRSFLSRWKPNLVIWSEQEIWPGFVNDCARLKIPQVWINARMADKAYNSRKWLKPFFGDLYANFELISAQDEKTAQNIMMQISLANTEYYSDNSSYYITSNGKCTPNTTSSKNIESNLLGNGDTQSLHRQILGSEVKARSTVEFLHWTL